MPDFVSASDLRRAEEEPRPMEPSPYATDEEMRFDEVRRVIARATPQNVRLIRAQLVPMLDLLRCFCHAWGSPRAYEQVRMAEAVLVQVRTVDDLKDLQEVLDMAERQAEARS